MEVVVGPTRRITHPRRQVPHPFWAHPVGKVELADVLRSDLPLRQSGKQDVRIDCEQSRRLCGDEHVALTRYDHLLLEDLSQRDVYR